MRNFELSRDMTTMTGKFYPTGHILLMLPDAGAADAAGRALVDAGLADDDIMLITPEVMMSQIVRTVGNSDVPLPSAGTEADTVRRFAQCARSCGSLPPSCRATGCSAWPKSRCRGTSPCSSAPVVTISV